MLSVNFVFHVACFKLFIAFKFNKGKSSYNILAQVVVGIGLITSRRISEKSRVRVEYKEK